MKIMPKRIVFWGRVLWIALWILLAGNIAPLWANNVKIVAGSSLISDIVLALTEGEAEVLTVIPGASCPGHEAVKTTDMFFAADADMILVHAFQQKLPWLSSMKTAGEDGKPQIVVLETEGSWLVPEVQKEAVRDIAVILADAFPAWRETLFERARTRLACVDTAEREVLTRLAPLKGSVVAASEMQADFVRWAGLEVPVTYGRPEAMHPMELVEQIQRLSDRHIAGVIDNWQSGADAGLPLAMELAVPHVVLSGFPGFRKDVPDYGALLRYNAEQLLKLGAE